MLESTRGRMLASAPTASGEVSFLFYSLKSFFQVFNNIIYILCSD